MNPQSPGEPSKPPGAGGLIYRETSRREAASGWRRHFHVLPLMGNLQFTKEGG
jgi:hypothetical protein